MLLFTGWQRLNKSNEAGAGRGSEAGTCAVSLLPFRPVLIIREAWGRVISQQGTPTEPTESQTSCSVLYYVQSFLLPWSGKGTGDIPYKMFVFFPPTQQVWFSGPGALPTLGEESDTGVGPSSRG